MILPKFAKQKQALTLLKKLSGEFSVVRNPSYVYPDYELSPLAAHAKLPLNELAASVTDMDGTTTTTETLCLHSLEYMVGRVTGKCPGRNWRGLDRKNDYPHIIGNSTTKHVEYLIKTYGEEIKKDKFRDAYVEAARWTLSRGKDENRKKEVLTNLKNFGFADPGQLKRDAKFRPATFEDTVRSAMDIYYHRYHDILSAIKSGQGALLSKRLFSDPTRNLIEPMPGIGVFLAAVKGLLGEDLELFYDGFRDHLLSHPKTRYSGKELEKYKARLAPLGRYFQRHPLKIAVVTSSIYYEADIVLGEVFRVLRGQVAGWPIKYAKKKAIIRRFGSYSNIYDGFITATDSSEIRLKPHRDLYSMALFQMGIPREKFGKVIGFEDSEPGITAIRAAGIGLSVAVPFADTLGHNLDAAAHILYGGLPEAILAKNLFLAPSRM
jgi:hypothetical protein